MAARSFFSHSNPIVLVSTFTKHPSTVPLILTHSHSQLNNICLHSSRRRQPRQRSSSFFAVSAAASGVSAVEKDDFKLEPLPAELNVTETPEPGSRVSLHVEVPPVVCQDCYKRVLREISKQIKVPGFRPGKPIPDNILLNYVGKQQVQRATIESILKRTLPHAMVSISGKALKDSVRIKTKFSEMDETFSPQDFMSYAIVVDVVPEVKWATEDAYRNLKVIVEMDPEITAEMAAEIELKRRLKSLGAMKIVTGRGLQIGDVVVLDIFATTINEDNSTGEKIPSADTKGFHFDTEEGDNLIPGFLDALIEIQQGETRSFPLVFPESWKQDNLRGVHAQFTVECKELFYRDLPELEDSLADKLLPGCKTLNEVQESILERCKYLEQTAKEQATDNAILDQLCKMIEVDIPQSLFEEQGRQLYGAKLLELQASTKLSEEQLASLSSQKSVNQYLNHQRANITKIIKQMLAAAEVFKCEDLQFSTEELVKEVENSVDEFKRNNQEYDEERIKERVQEILEGAKVLEWLREHAQIEYITR